MWRVRCFFAWYDFWVGWFFDRKKRRLYVLPLPMVGIEIQLPHRCHKSVGCAWCDAVRAQDGTPEGL